VSCPVDDSMDLIYRSALQENKKIIGVDEAGRGCLCGPVFAAAVTFNPSNIPDFNKEAPLSKKTNLIYKDSKLLTPEKREVLFADICKNHWVGVGFSTSAEVDQINILQASLLAMNRAVQNLKKNCGSSQEQKVLIGHVVVDGNQKIPKLMHFTQSTLIKGDQLVSEISAASIVAKVSRDRYVDQLDLKYPEYEFRKHKGYGTLLHREKIKEFGPCPEHRATFKGVREFLHIQSGQSYQGPLV
jgi:ribonuclease HII